MRAAVGVVLELPQMDELVDRPGVGLEVANEVPVMASLTERRKTDFLVELHRLGHRADAERIGSQLVESPQDLLDQSGLQAAMNGIPYSKRFGPWFGISSRSSDPASAFSLEPRELTLLGRRFRRWNVGFSGRRQPRADSLSV
jgi:hypothetical protein